MAMIPIGRFTVPDDHPCLPGHFPGQPIVPGVVVLDEALSLVQARVTGASLCGLAAAKFTSLVLPGQILEVLCADDADSSRVEFTCVTEGTTVMRATALFAVTAG